MYQQKKINHVLAKRGYKRELVQGNEFVMLAARGTIVTTTAKEYDNNDENNKATTAAASKSHMYSSFTVD